MKGIILHGGHGTRLRPLTHTGPKQLLHIANKPMSQYALEDLRDAGIEDIAIIIGDSYPNKVREYYGDGSKFGVKLTYIFQDLPKGIAHAVGLCKEFVGNEKFVVYLGDNILRKGLEGSIKKFESSKSDSKIMLCEVGDPSRFGIAEFKKGEIIKIIEKPKNSSSNLAVIGVYFFTPVIFDIIEKLQPSWRGELEITDALQQLLNGGFEINYEIVTGWWKDTGTPDDILEANRLILDTVGSEKQLISHNNSNIHKKIIIENNVSITRDSFITGPVIVGKNCKIGPKVRIGPYVSIGNNTILKNCEVKNSIIMDDCEITAKIEILGSIIAQGSQISKNEEPKKLQFLLGERSRIKI